MVRRMIRMYSDIKNDSAVQKKWYPVSFFLIICKSYARIILHRWHICVNIRNKYCEQSTGLHSSSSIGELFMSIDSLVDVNETNWHIGS